MGRIVFLLGVFLCAVGVGAAIVVATGPFTSDEAPVLSPEEAADANATVAASVPLEGQIPTLTDQDIAAVRDMVLADTRVRSLLGDRALTITSMGIWQEEATKIGAAVIILVDPPASVNADLPVLLRAPESATPTTSAPVQGAEYRVGVHHFEGPGMVGIQVLVDLRTSEVVAISPIFGIFDPTPTPATTTRMTGTTILLRTVEWGARRNKSGCADTGGNRRALGDTWPLRHSASALRHVDGPS